MTPERWKKIEELYEAALGRPAGERSRFLAEACGDDDLETRREVESLLAQTDDPRFEPLGWVHAISLPDESQKDLAPGFELGPYRIQHKIGAGGMGAVYCALDSRLGREVAIKVAAAQFTGRFQREARAIAALNHPHICTLHDIGPDFLVMELVHGETLAARLERGRLSIADTISFGAQIAGALAAAHDKGIVHRDLKPGNLMVSGDTVKVLDFGLAKSANEESITRSNVILGTPAYMAPEQRDGKATDARTDIYALGLVLHEMATGERVATGEAPRLAGVPDRLSHVIERCLARAPEDRWQSARDVKAELTWSAREAVSAGTAPVPPRALSSRVAWAIAAVASAGLVASGLLLWRRPPVARRATQFTISFEKEIGAIAPNVMPVPSPDGQYLAFPGTGKAGALALWIRSLDSVQARELGGTEGVDALVWSPDGKWIAFHADGKLKKVSPAGGAPQIIADVPGFQDAAWGSQNQILYRPTNRAALFRVPADGGTPQPATNLNAALTENSHRGPQFLPDGRRFLFTSRCGTRANNALYLGSLDSSDVKRLMPAQSQVRYVPAGSDHSAVLLYYLDGPLVSRPFDADREAFVGEPTQVLEHVGYDPPGIQARFRVSNDGRVLIAGASVSQSRLFWVTRDGDDAGSLGPAGEYVQPRLSPQGDRVAFSRPDPQTGNRDVFYMEVSRGIISRLTTHVANDWFPVWAPDGQRLLFGSDRNGGTAMHPYFKNSMDPGSSEELMTDLAFDPSDWSRDGQWIAFGDGDLRIARASGGEKPFLFLGTPFREANARFSPDGHWIAYVSNETGPFEVYARPFDGRAVDGRKVQLSVSGGGFPVWGPTTDELFYMSADAVVYAVDTSHLKSATPIPTPLRLFQACKGTVPSAMPTVQPYASAFDTRDGKRFLVDCLIEPPGRFTVLVDWTARQ